MRRSLVLTNEAARHPFRASLPAHIFVVEEEIGPQYEPEVKAAMAGTQNKAPAPDRAIPASAPNWWQLSRSDVRGFASTYLATFLAVLVFIM